jgi:hypothetical protein
LPTIKSKYKLTTLELVVDNAEEEKEKVHIEATINPGRKGGARTVQRIVWPPNVTDLAWHVRKGGHLNERHIGVSNAYLQGRRLYEFKSGEAPASRWTGPTAAASVIFQVVSGNKTKIINWIEKGTPAGDLGLDFKGTPGAKLGEGYKRASAN